MLINIPDQDVLLVHLDLKNVSHLPQGLLNWETTVAG